MNAGENMKFKYFFVLFVILTAIFLIGCVAASENQSHNANVSDDTYLSVDGADSNHPISSPEDGDPSVKEDRNSVKKSESSGDEIDLCVNMELGDIKKTTYGINEVTFDVPLIITANVDGGIAKNTRIFLVIPEDFEYVSDNCNIGTYNHESGIWDIGDLKSGVSANLTIFTQITKKGNYVITLNSTTDSNDLNLTNNNLNCNIQVSSKITSNTTRTTADSKSARHDSHYASDPEASNRQNDEQSKTTANDGHSSDSTDKRSSGTKNNGKGNSNINGEIGSSSGSKNSKKSDSNEDVKSDSRITAVKEASSIGRLAKSVSNTLNSMLNHDSSSNDDSNNQKTVKAISFYNYEKVPLLVIGLFFVALIGTFAYDKIKS